MKLRFKAGSAAQFVEVQCGEYKRRFERAEQPFEVGDAEARMLADVDDLEPAPAKPPLPPPEDGTQDDAPPTRQPGRKSAK